jgi:hypothetical protein
MIPSRCCRNTVSSDPFPIIPVSLFVLPTLLAANQRPRSLSKCFGVGRIVQIEILRSTGSRLEHFCILEESIAIAAAEEENHAVVDALALVLEADGSEISKMWVSVCALDPQIRETHSWCPQ